MYVYCFPAGSYRVRLASKPANCHQADKWPQLSLIFNGVKLVFNKKTKVRSEGRKEPKRCSLLSVVAVSLLKEETNKLQTGLMEVVIQFALRYAISRRLKLIAPPDACWDSVARGLTPQ